MLLLFHVQVNFSPRDGARQLGGVSVTQRPRHSVLHFSETVFSAHTGLADGYAGDHPFKILPSRRSGARHCPNSAQRRGGVR